MPTKIELEAKISGLEFSLRNILSTVDQSINIYAKLGADRSLTDFESGALFQAKRVKESLESIIKSGAMVSQDYLDIRRHNYDELKRRD